MRDQATTGTGRRYPLGNGIAKKTHAEWLANDMRSNIGFAYLNLGRN